MRPATGDGTPMEQSDMKDTNGRKKPKSSGRTTPELRVVEVNYSPGPNAQDRLRRLVALLVKYAVRDRQLPPRADSSPDGAGEEG